MTSKKNSVIKPTGKRKQPEQEESSSEGDEETSISKRNSDKPRTSRGVKNNRRRILEEFGSYKRSNELSHEYDERSEKTGKLPKKGSIERLLKSHFDIRLNSDAVQMVAQYLKLILQMVTEKTVILLEYSRKKVVTQDMVKMAVKNLPRLHQSYKTTSAEDIMVCNNVDKAKMKAQSIFSRFAKKRLSRDDRSKILLESLKADFSDYSCLMLQRAPIENFVREFGDKIMEDVKWSKEALELIQVVAEKEVFKLVSIAVAEAAASGKKSLNMEFLEVADYARRI